jgi:transcriptional regulator with XRE-family HTH domain
MTPEQAKALGAFIRSRREACQLSARGLAAAADVDVTTVTRLEGGEFANPTPDKLRRIAHVLGVSSTDLFALADYVTPDELPAPALYLRVKYPDLPTAAVDEMARMLAEQMREHGVQLDGPQPGEDE